MTDRIKIVDVEVYPLLNEKFTLQVEDTDGNVWQFDGSWNTSSKATKALTHVYRVKTINPNKWRHVRTVYGSKAWREEEWAYAEREWEEDMRSGQTRFW